MQLFSIKYTFNFSVLHYVLVFGSSVEHFSIRKQNVTVTSGRDNKRFSLLPLDETFEIKPLFEVTVENTPPPFFVGAPGVWSKPRHVVVNASAVELYWDQPSQPNGHVSQYRLTRDGHTVFTGDHRDQNYTDAGLLPNHR